MTLKNTIVYRFILYFFQHSRHSSILAFLAFAVQHSTSRNISDCSHFLILVSIRTALLTNIKFGEGWSQPSNETQNLVDRSLKTLNFKQTFFVQNNLNYTLVAEYWLRQYKGYFRTLLSMATRKGLSTQGL